MNREAGHGHRQGQLGSLMNGVHPCRGIEYHPALKQECKNKQGKIWEWRDRQRNRLDEKAPEFVKCDQWQYHTGYPN